MERLGDSAKAKRLWIRGEITRGFSHWSVHDDADAHVACWQWCDVSMMWQVPGEGWISQSQEDKCMMNHTLRHPNGGMVCSYWLHKEQKYSPALLKVTHVAWTRVTGENVEEHYSLWLMVFVPVCYEPDDMCTPRYREHVSDQKPQRRLKVRGLRVALFWTFV